jgi:hypothetical protein
MPTATNVPRQFAVHSAPVNRLVAQMADEEDKSYLLDWLAWDAANYVYAFLTAVDVPMQDRSLRDAVLENILEVLKAHRIDARDFALPTARPNRVE